MESKLRDLLDKIYELEGLVHLALKRLDSQEDFIRLINTKGEEVGHICNALKKEHVPQLGKTDQHDDVFILDEYAIEETSEDESPLSVEKSIADNIDTHSGSSVLSQETQKGKLVFSINERFRFRKELFDNSDADFNNTLALVASMDNYEEAEEYFYNEEGFDETNNVVKEFMEVLKRYFK